MIRRCFTVSIILATLGFAQSEPKIPASRPRLPEERLRMPVATPADKKESVPDGERAIMMAPVAVTARKATATSKEEPPKSQPFTLRDGGTFLKREGPKVTTEVKFQFRGGSWDILSFSW